MTAASHPLLLCSASPRRAALLTAAGIAFERGRAPDIDETPPPGVAVDHVAITLAKAKARRASALAPERLVLCADTTVILDGSILDKPRDAVDAAEMLSRLSGRTHLVVTGIAMARCGDVACGKLVSASDEARVTFRALSSPEIDAYVATGEPFGKAGGYAVQGGAAPFVLRLDGDVETVVGLPTRIVRSMLDGFEALGATVGR